MFLDKNNIKMKQGEKPYFNPKKIIDMEGLEIQVYNNYHSKYNPPAFDQEGEDIPGNTGDPYHFENYYIETDVDLENAIVNIVNQQLDFAKEGGNLDKYKIEVVTVEHYREEDFESNVL